VKYESVCNGDPCTPMIIAALFTIAKLWNQPWCASTDGYNHNHVAYVHNGVLFSNKDK
jgi:hypothetical protein